jgi:hypothetical protein
MAEGSRSISPTAVAPVEEVEVVEDTEEEVEDTVVVEADEGTAVVVAATIKKGTVAVVEAISSHTVDTARDTKI